MLSLSAAGVELRAVTPSMYPSLYDAMMQADSLGSWRMSGAAVPYEDFANSLVSGVFAQFAVVQTDSLRVLGLVQGISASFRHGTCGLGVFSTREGKIGARTVIGALLFIEYLFSEFPMRKIYAESTAPAFAGFSSGVGRLFEVEGRLRAHEWHDGEYQDSIIAALTREVWQRSATRDRLLNRV